MTMEGVKNGPSNIFQMCNVNNDTEEAPSTNMDLDEDEEMYQSMNAELDKQIAEDMAAIEDYLATSDESVAKRIEFFNKMDKTILGCIDNAPVTDHILYQHTPLGNIKWHECSQCEYRAKEKSKLLEHLMSNHASLTGIRGAVKLSEKKFVCKDCEEHFKTNSELLRHMGDVHDAVIFKCDQCSFVASERGDLRHHVMTEHIKLNVIWKRCFSFSLVFHVVRNKVDMKQIYFVLTLPESGIYPEILSSIFNI